MFYLFVDPQHFLYFFFDPQAQRSLGFCFFVLDLFASVVFLLFSVGSSFVSPVEGSNLTNLLCSALYSFQCSFPHLLVDSFFIESELLDGCFWLLLSIERVARV